MLNLQYLLDYNIRTSNLNKEKVLIIGNSHADDALNIFSRVENFYNIELEFKNLVETKLKAFAELIVEDPF